MTSVAAERSVAGRAVVLLSGGLDSATALAWAGERGYQCFALSVAYGQRHHAELAAAACVAQAHALADDLRFAHAQQRRLYA